MALTPPLPLSQQTSGHSSTRKSYHIRRESAVLTSKTTPRLRSHTDIDEYHAQCAQNFVNRHKRPGNKSRKKVRTFDSQHIKCNDNDTNQFPYHSHTKYTNQYMDNYQNQLQDMMQQFRDIVVPLQTEIKALKEITKELQTQVHILQQENDIYRKYRYNDSNRASYIDDGYDYTSNALDQVLPMNSSLSVNPAYLFSPQSKRTRTISNAIICRPHKDNNIDKMGRTISQEMEEDTLEIGSGLKSVDNHGINNDDVSLNVDIAELDHIQQTPETVSSIGSQSIEKTYHYAPSLSDPRPHSLPSPTPVSSLPALPLNPVLNTSISVKLYKTPIKRSSKRYSNVSFV